MYLGVDLGTSGVKVLIISSYQAIVASATAPLDVFRKREGWSEQNPGDWIAATEAAIGQLRTTHSSALSAVKGIGLSGQMHGATLLDHEDKVLRPCILWNDTRAYRQAAQLDADPRFRKLTGNIVFPGFTAPKLVWVKQNEPEIFAATAKILLPKDYLRLWLTGEHISEMSDASGTGWLNVGKRCWSEELLNATDVTLDHMPRLVEGTEQAGTLRSELANRWGMGKNIVVAGGAGDNAASACGTGVVKPGFAFLSLGTSGVLFAANAQFLPNPDSAVHTFCHALPATWHQMGVILSATDALNWLAGITSMAAPALSAELGGQLRAPSSVTFLPYLSGERTPYNDALIRGSLTGLGHGSDRVALTQAVIEGVAFAFRDSLEALKQAGTTVERMVAVGGGSRSTYWLNAIATALNLPIDVQAEGDHGAALGAARLGLIAATGADPFGICIPPPIAVTIEPGRAQRASYEDAYQRYRALYPAIRGVTS